MASAGSSPRRLRCSATPITPFRRSRATRCPARSRPRSTRWSRTRSSPTRSAARSSTRSSPSSAMRSSATVSGCRIGTSPSTSTTSESDMTQTTFIDLSDHDAFVEEVPHAAFAQLRAEDPVHWNPEPDDGPGFWAVTRYEDIRTVHRDVETYSSEIGGTSLEDLDPEQIKARKSMIDMDPPRHDELRGLIARRFTPRAVGVWEDQVRSVTREVLDLALPKGEFDFVRDVSSEIPMQGFAEILGVPHDERRVIIELGDRLLGNQDPEYRTPPPTYAEAHNNLPFSSPAALEMFEFGRRLAKDRR